MKKLTGGGHERLDEVEGMEVRGAKSLRKKLESAREMAFLSKQLALVSTDAPVDTDNLGWLGANRETLQPLFNRLGFDFTSRIRRWGS